MQVNAKQAKELFELAREKHLFLMEGAVDEVFSAAHLALKSRFSGLDPFLPFGVRAATRHRVGRDWRSPAGEYCLSSSSGILGLTDASQVVADLSIQFGNDDLDPGHRMNDPNLAGGAVLDLG